MSRQGMTSVGNKISLDAVEEEGYMGTLQKRNTHKLCAHTKRVKLDERAMRGIKLKPSLMRID
jgi:hypothetical protein